MFGRRMVRLRHESSQEGKQVEALGPPWSKTMDVYKQARDKQLEIVNASDETTAIKTAWRKYHQRHYEKLIRLIVKLTKKRKQSAKLTTGRPADQSG
jgi:hypothetical protein